MHEYSANKLTVLYCCFMSLLVTDAAIIHRNRVNSGSNSNSGTNSNNMQVMTGGMPYYDMNLNLSEVEDLHDEQALISRLLWGYDPAARPVYNASNPVVVQFSFSLIQLCDMDERNQVLTINVWLDHEWIDERLTWNHSDYNGLAKIRIPCNRLWLPDIVLYNSADDYTEGYMQAKVVVGEDGSIFWSPPAKLRSSCKIDVTYFPFDDQVCFLKFGSWTYSGLQLDLINRTSDVDLTNYVPSGEWELRSAIIERNVQFYPCCPGEPYQDIHFFIFIRRKILYYLFNIIFPCIWLSILSVVGFWLPPDSGEKVTLGITVLLAFSVFMLLIAENIPATSETVPLIGIYLTTVMSLTSISIIFTVFVLQLHHSGQFAPAMNKKFYKFVTENVASWVGMKETVRRFQSTRLDVHEDIETFKARLDTDKDKDKEKLKTTLIECKNNFNMINYDLGNIKKKNIDKENLLCLSCLCCCIKSAEMSENKFTQSQMIKNCDINSEIQYIRNSYKKNSIASYTSNDNNNNLHNIKLIRHENKINYDILEENEGQIYIAKQPGRQKHSENKKNMIDNNLFNNRNAERKFDKIYSSQNTPARFYSPPMNNRNPPLNLFTYNKPNIKLKSFSPPQPTETLTFANKGCVKCQALNNNYDFNTSTHPLRTRNVNRTNSPDAKKVKSTMKTTKRSSSTESLEEFSTTIKQFIRKQDQVVENTNLQNEWKLLALIFDRCLFWIFTVLIGSSSILLLVVVPMLKNDEMIKRYI